MGISCEGDTSEKECRIPLTNGESSSMDDGLGVIEMEFWPLEHPTEPSDEDQPVKCPMSDSSAINAGNNRSTVTPRKRMDSTTRLTKITLETNVIGDGGGYPAARPDRKRHHTLTHDDIIITPIMRPAEPPSPAPTSARELTVLQILHQTDHSCFKPAV